MSFINKLQSKIAILDPDHSRALTDIAQIRDGIDQYFHVKTALKFNCTNDKHLRITLECQSTHDTLIVIHISYTGYQITFMGTTYHDKDSIEDAIAAHLNNGDKISFQLHAHKAMQKHLFTSRNKTETT